MNRVVLFMLKSDLINFFLLSVKNDGAFPIAQNVSSNM